MNTPTVTAVPGKPNLLLGTYDVADLGYVAEEFFVSGTADAYAAVGELGPDGRWSAARSARADYTTRIVVLRPSDAAAFNGTLLVEWLNVSGGIDAPALWFMAHREMIREGYAYVAVSAQRVGVEGGASLGFDMSLKTQDPARYSSLRHPGDGFSYDIFSRVGRLARDGERTGALGLPHPEHVVALGESQSALFMTTYVNAVDPLAKVYDGFLVHSRFAPAAPLDGASIFEASGAPLPAAVRFRPDLRVPVLTVITETDLVGGPGAGYHLARQPTTTGCGPGRLRAPLTPTTTRFKSRRIDTGSASLDDLAAAYAPTKTLMGQELAHAINFAPQHHYVLQAALATLHSWVRTGEPAPHAPRIELSDADPPRLVLDAHGLAEGGIRTPWIDVPTARTSGLGTDDSPLSAALRDR